jgi:DNA-directed RNA polymerase subunit RPC12/RpoP
MGMFETRNYTELPHGIRKGVEKYIREEESILVTLLNWRAIYRAPRFIDSNTYFNSWFILTSHRIIIARNSSVFKRFRDIPLSGISQIFYELDNTEPRISITSPGHEDIIEFPRQASHHCAKLEETVKEAVANAMDLIKNLPGGDYIYCSRCGSRIPGSNHFCSECGAKIHKP